MEMNQALTGLCAGNSAGKPAGLTRVGNAQCDELRVAAGDESAGLARLEVGVALKDGVRRGGAFPLNLQLFQHDIVEKLEQVLGHTHLAIPSVKGSTRTGLVTPRPDAEHPCARGAKPVSATSGNNT